MNARHGVHGIRDSNDRENLGRKPMVGDTTSGDKAGEGDLETRSGPIRDANLRPQAARNTLGWE